MTGVFAVSKGTALPVPCTYRFLLLFALLSRVPVIIRAHLSERVSQGVLGAFWEAFGWLLGFLAFHWDLLGISWGVLGAFWVAFASPGESLGGSRGLQGVSWPVVGAFLGCPSGGAVPT